MKNKNNITSSYTISDEDELVMHAERHVGQDWQASHTMSRHY